MSYFYTEDAEFFGNSNPEELIAKYGSPLYVYNENIFRERCKEMKMLIDYPNFTANYSIKANSNLELLKIAREEGLYADAMSPGELHVLLAAGFRKEQLFYISNNADEEEMKFAKDIEVIVSIDSLSQLKMYGELCAKSDPEKIGKRDLLEESMNNRKVAIRFNPGVGAGHHEKVVTAGKKTKFGITSNNINEVKSICKEYGLKVIGLNQHIGSLFLEPDAYVEAAGNLLDIAEHFEDLVLIDFGGGFGIPYHKQENQSRLDLEKLGLLLTPIVKEWAEKHDRKIMFKSEPGRYISAECGVILGKVNAIKENGGMNYIGTDIGFNVLARPAMYDSWHDLEFYRNGRILEESENNKSEERSAFIATIVGNICESGDILAKDRKIPTVKVGDICGVMDAGAYGFSMSSNYNNRLRPAEVLICIDGSDRLIRRRETLDDLMDCFI